jgi:hypothetical protein
MPSIAYTQGRCLAEKDAAKQKMVCSAVSNSRGLRDWREPQAGGVADHFQWLAKRDNRKEGDHDNAHTAAEYHSTDAERI